MLIATAVAATLSYVPAGAMAASADDLAQIRDQLQTLMQRVDKLEQENTELKTENDSLKSQTDYLKSETKGLRKDAANTAVDVSKVKGADWAGKVAFTGDFRYRYEMISDDTLNASGVQNTADRYRDRIRARINTTVKATDTITLGFGFATTEGGDPRSSNQTLSGTFSRKSLDLDTAYFDWKFASWGDLIGGKM
jgi:TolA-binding protein